MEGVTAISEAILVIANRWFTALTAFAVTFGYCRVAHANSISPYVYFWPGIIFSGIVYAFPASLLAAFLERPFLTAAGIKRRPLVLSMRANFVSTIIGILLVPIGYPALYAIGPIWCIAAFGISCAVEVSFLQRFSHQSLTWGWLVTGNAVSSVVLMLLPPIAIAVRQHNYRLAWSLEPHQVWLGWLSFGLSAAIFLGSFAWSVGSKSETISTDSDAHDTIGSGSQFGDTPNEIETEVAK